MRWICGCVELFMGYMDSRLGGNSGNEKLFNIINFVLRFNVNLYNKSNDNWILIYLLKYIIIMTTDYIDYYLLHALDGDSFKKMKEMGALSKETFWWCMVISLLLTWRVLSSIKFVLNIRKNNTKAKVLAYQTWTYVPQLMQKRKAYWRSLSDMPRGVLIHRAY